jgi:hypothetical protein
MRVHCSLQCCGSGIVRVGRATGQLGNCARVQADTIEKMAMLSMRNVRTILHCLFKHGYLTVQEIPRTADRTPSKTVYVYHVSFAHAIAQLRRDMLASAGARMRPATCGYRRPADLRCVTSLP